MRAAIAIMANAISAMINNLIHGSGLLSTSVFCGPQCIIPTPPMVQNIFIALAQSNLASSCQKNGKFEEAAELLETAVSVFDVQLGPAHPTLAMALDNLGGSYQKLERWEDAETAMLRSLAIYERALGQEAPDVVIVLSNISGLYERRHRFVEAMSYLERCVEIMKKTHDTTGELMSYFSRLVMLRMRASDEGQKI
jgi:tetratricopeptide (TPR) repeat protein